MAESYSDSIPSGIKVGNQTPEKLLAYDGVATSLHQKTISRLIARRRLSERSMNRRYDSWNAVDENCRLFIDLTRSTKHDSTKAEIPWARSIVVPMSYAILQVYLTQLMGIFTKRDPAMEIQGVGAEDVKPAKLMNAVIAYDQVQTNYILELHTAIKDAMKYGLGGFNDCWFEKFGYKTSHTAGFRKKLYELMGLPTTNKRWTRLTQYNQVVAFDPFNVYPDPRLSISNIQRGEFFFQNVWTGYLEILSNSQDNGGIYFNTERVPKSSAKQQALRSRSRFQASQMNLIGSADERDKGFHCITSGVVNLIPSEWELGDGDRPEKWHFAWVDDTVIIRAHAMDYEHGDYPFSGFESDIDTHVFGNQGSIESLDGLQRFMTWKYNSHVQNLLRHLNNRMLYDPALVEAYDVENPDAGMHIRLTALGSQLLRDGRLTMDQMIHQLELADVTSQMMKEISFDMDLAMRMSGAADQMMGRTTQERRTLGEVSRVGHEGSARMAYIAIMMDVQGLRPMALRWCANRQQYTDQEQYVRVAGNVAAEFGGNRVLVKPDDIQGNFDYIPRTGPEPGDPGEMAATLMDGLAAIMKEPAILSIPDRNGNFLDPHEFIKEMLRDRRVTNVDDFYRSMGATGAGQQAPMPNVQVVPDAQVQQQAQAGNVIPMQQAA